MEILDQDLITLQTVKDDFCDSGNIYLTLGKSHKLPCYRIDDFAFLKSVLELKSYQYQEYENKHSTTTKKKTNQSIHIPTLWLSFWFSYIFL